MPKICLSQSAIVRIWHAFGLQPHRIETFKLSSDPLFIEKVRDVVGLSMSPPEKAIVLSVDEKSQIQALDRSQPGLPLGLGHTEKHTHDYVRYAVHFTPTSASWLNLVERFFAEITVKRIRRGAFKSVKQLIAAIEDYLAPHNTHPKPFHWTATADEILGKLNRLCKRISNSGQ